jgi:membrane protein implicated in regulation of membrane protease activity
LGSQKKRPALQMDEQFMVAKTPAERLRDIGVGVLCMVAVLAALSTLLWFFGGTVARAWGLPWSFKIAFSLTLTVHILLLPFYATLVSRGGSQGGR